MRRREPHFAELDDLEELDGSDDEAPNYVWIALGICDD
jgi:hypothetical protein